MKPISLVAVGAVLVAISCTSSRAGAQVVVVDEEYCRVHWWGVGRCWNRPHRHPIATTSVELGASHFEEGHPFAFDSGTGSVTQTGPAWGLRLGVDLLPWFGLEGRYVGSYISGNAQAAGVGFLMTGGEFVVRFTLPTPYVRPYVFGGIGVYGFALLGSDAATTASMLNSSTQSGVPIGIGVEVPLSWHVSFAVEAAYRFLIGESFSANDAIGGADLTTFSGVMRFRL